MRRSAYLLPLVLVVAAQTASECENRRDGGSDERSSNRVEININQETKVITRGRTSDAVQKVVVRQSSQHGVLFDGEPFCEPRVRVADDDRSASGTVKCVGRTDEGKRVVATFDGSVYVSSCDGVLVVVVDEQQVFVSSDLSGCAISAE